MRIEWIGDIPDSADHKAKIHGEQRMDEEIDAKIEGSLLLKRCTTSSFTEIENKRSAQVATLAFTPYKTQDKLGR